MSIYDFEVTNASGDRVSLSKYEGKVLLIVNTATGCGLTPQYEGLQKIYDTYRDKGFEILDFPCNQFGEQAPGTTAEIGQFCAINFGTTFDQFEKIDVNGPNESPLFKYLKSQKGGLLSSKIKWNFTKFLVNQKGNVVRRFAPTDRPEKLEKHLIELL